MHEPSMAATVGSGSPARCSSISASRDVNETFSSSVRLGYPDGMTDGTLLRGEVFVWW